MRNITFMPPNKEAILNGNKWLTARYWVTEYGESFKVGDEVTLSTNRKTESRFAVAEIKNIVKWDGWKFGNASTLLDMSCTEIADAEGFMSDYGEFYDTYRHLNKHLIENEYESKRRSHFFIAFEVVEELKDGDDKLMWDFYVFHKDIVSINHRKARKAILKAFKQHLQWLEQEHAETHPALKPSESMTPTMIAEKTSLPLKYVEQAMIYLKGEGRIVQRDIHPHEGPRIKAYRLNTDEND